MQHENIRPRHALPNNEIERALILQPEHSTIYRDPRFVAVVWSVDASNKTTAQVLGCQRRCLPFLARYVSVTTGLGISATALRVRDRAIPTRGEFIATEIECPQCDGQRAHKQARQRAAPGHEGTFDLVHEGLRHVVVASSESTNPRIRCQCDPSQNTRAQPSHTLKCW